MSLQLVFYSRKSVSYFLKKSKEVCNLFLAQHQELTYKDFILYISDDCSTDNTWNIINEYASKDNRIKIFSKRRNIFP